VLVKASGTSKTGQPRGVVRHLNDCDAAASVSSPVFVERPDTLRSGQRHARCEPRQGVELGRAGIRLALTLESAADDAPLPRRAPEPPAV
jgi:hypothetical protein